LPWAKGLPNPIWQGRPPAGPQISWVAKAWSLHSGSLRLVLAEGGRRLTAPVSLLTSPGLACELDLPPVARFQRLLFTVRAAPRRPLRDGQAWTIVGPWQPDARTWFGIELPPLVTGADAGHLAHIIDDGCQDWWRSPLRRLALGFRLGAWLTDFALRTAEGRSGGWEALGAWAREHLADGLGVAGLAAHAGCSRSQLVRRMRAEPGRTPSAFLGRLRRDAARTLAADPALRAADIARACGYGRSDSLTRALRRWRSG
jgi:AraC-like DNA-binding protein